MPHLSRYLMISVTTCAVLYPSLAQGYTFGDGTRCVIKRVVKRAGQIRCLLAGDSGPAPLEQAQRLLALLEFQEHSNDLGAAFTDLNTKTSDLASTNNKDMRIIQQAQQTILDQKERIKLVEESYWDQMVAEDPTLQRLNAQIDAFNATAQGTKLAKVLTKAERVQTILSLIPFEKMDKVASLLQRAIEKGKARQTAALESELVELKAQVEETKDDLKKAIDVSGQIDVRNATAKQAYMISMESINGEILRKQTQIIEAMGRIVEAQKALVTEFTPRLEAIKLDMVLKLRGAKCSEIASDGDATISKLAACKTSILSENFPAAGACDAINDQSTPAQVKACIAVLMQAD